MAEKDSIFLSTQQAITAVCLDFQQYAPQVLLFREVLGVLSKEDLLTKHETGKNGIWISMPGETKMVWLEGPELIRRMCKILTDNPPELLVLSAVCARVFQTRTCPEKNPASGRPGIRILTGMQEFTCHQCGTCCRTLDYHNDITADDVADWKRARRDDILDWVGVFKKKGHETVYRVWMIPGSRTFAEACPFLQKIPHENRWTCRAHDVKPRICRQYPVNRKHARMTGCPGFTTK